ncbi:MAG TPA: YceI family protein [Xanthomonadales bacterium]|nr:YceI family protein [Xanthomonadales bacterium]
MRRILLAAVVSASLIAAPAFAADKYTIDPNHTQVRIGWTHFGFSDIEAVFTNVSGEVMVDTADWTKSSVNATIPISGLVTGNAKLDEHLRSPDFFDMAKFGEATFKSTKVEKAGDNQLKVTGDLTIHGVTKPVTLDVKVNKVGQHPMTKKDAAGFSASGTLKRTEFGVGQYAPNVSDDIRLEITTETAKAG